MGAIKERNGHDLAKAAYDLRQRRMQIACLGNRMHAPQSCINNSPIPSSNPGKELQPKHKQ